MFLARLITKVHCRPERLEACLQDAASTLGDSVKNAHVVGITGSTASGKSTLIDKIIRTLREDNETVIVLMIDPTKTESGGSILADAVCMRDHYLDSGVFLRSFPSRGATSALTTSLPQVIELVSLFADFVIVETAGAGQGDVALSQCVDTYIVLPDKQADAINFLKEGPHHYAHILAVNVREGSEDDAVFFSRIPGLVSMLVARDGWEASAFRVNAYTGEGVPDLVREGVYTHRDFLKKPLSDPA